MTTKRRAALLAASILAAAAIFALEWPTDAPRALTTFGTRSDGRFSTGVELGSTDGLVRTAAAGDLAFVLDGDRLAGGFPSTLGAFAVVAHSRDLTTVYGGLEPGTLSSYLATVHERDILGRIRAPSGVPGGAAWFGVFDRAKDAWVNPLILLAPEKDAQIPQIRAVFLSNQERSFRLGEARSVRQGRYEVLLDAVDPAEAAPERAPYSLRLLVDGIERFACRFDSAAAPDGVLRFNLKDSRTGPAFYDERGFMRLGTLDLARGAAFLSVSVADFAGNASELTYQLAVE
ncbi:MAG: hypothetical protein JXA15_12885 [Spirochaetales bacterium]|nr:hypothetical protein [Spirochaetales bacterium]